MFDRIGVHLVWRAGEPAAGTRSGSAVIVQVSFTNQIPPDQHPGALAYAMPFAVDANVITVMYDRLTSMAGDRPSLKPTLLAHVLAHKTGHILKRTDQHAGTGVMQAHWGLSDFDDMAGKPLAFEPADVILIHHAVAIGVVAIGRRDSRPLRFRPASRSHVAFPGAAGAGRCGEHLSCQGPGLSLAVGA